MKTIHYSLLAAMALPCANFVHAGVPVVLPDYPPSNSATFTRIGRIAERAPATPLSGAEIPAFDSGSKRGFASSGNGIEVIDLTDPANPTYITNISVAGTAGSNDISSVACKNGILAAGVISNPKTNNGYLVLINPATGSILNTIQVGANPDDVTFTPDGMKILVANEGELAGEPANDTTPGSVSIVDISAGVGSPVVTTAGFAAFNAQAAALKAAGVRIFTGGTPEFDFEPEYIAISPDGTTAMVTLQEANAIGILDITNSVFTEIVPLGEKNFSGLYADFSDRDGPSNGVLINPTLGNPVFGLYMPDQIAAFQADGETYYITANEGDDRDDFMNPDETIRVGGSYDLDNATFPTEGTLKTNARLGRLTVSNAPGLRGDTEPDGDIDRILAYGGRSFSILDSNGTRVYDSGDMLEVIVATQHPSRFDDTRSDNKSIEPEGVTVATFGGCTFAFIALERSNMVSIFDVSNPLAPTYVNSIELPSDPSPEGMHVIAPSESPNGRALLMVASEGNGTLTIHQLDALDKFSLELFHIADQEANAAAVGDAPRLSAVLNALRAQDLGNDGLPDNTLTLSSGDAIIPGLFYEASEAVFGTAGIADIQIQNELGIQAIAFGNHEFDFGTGPIAALIDGSAPGNILGGDFMGTNFPYLSGNLNFATDTNMAPLIGTDHVAPEPNKVAATTVINVNGELIGVVAATTPTLGVISSPGTIGITPQPFAGSPSASELDDLAAVIQQDVDDLLAANPKINKVILLAHMQAISIEQALATRLSNVDIIVAGGSNTRLFDSNDRIRAGDTKQGNYPILLQDADSNPIAVVNTDGSYKYLGRLVIDFDDNGNIIPDSYDETISGAFATDEQGVTDLDAAGLVDQEIQEICDAIETQIVLTDGNWFGVTNVFLNGSRSGGGTDGVRNQETNLGNLTADANLAIGRENDGDVVLSLKNGGGIRASIGEIVVLPGETAASRIPPTANPLSGRPEGGISQNAIQGALAFNNGLTLLTLTREEIIALLEHGIAASTNEDSSAAGRFPQIGGVKMSFDLSEDEGERIINAGIFDDGGDLIAPLVVDGKLFGDPAETFRIVTLNFLANPNFDRSDGDSNNSNDPFLSGGDGYPFPNINSDSTEGEVQDPAVLERINPVELVQEGVQTGAATFADDGSEQDALAEFLAANYPNTKSAFGEEDTTRLLDERLQNLAFRDDSIFANGSPEIEVVLENGNSIVTGSGGISFGESDPGTSTTAFLTIVNLGVADLELTSLLLEGPQSDDFSVGSPSAEVIAPGDNATIAVTFTPSTPGVKTASLQIGSNDADEDPFLVLLEGSGSPTPVTSFIVRTGTKTLTDGKRKQMFGWTPVGTSSEGIIFEIENDGDVPIENIKISLSGANPGEFVVNKEPRDLVESGGRTRIRIRFQPINEGKKSALLSISNSATGEDLFDINLHGTGTLPKIAVFLGKKDLKSGKSTINVGGVASGSSGKTIRLRIKNIGMAELRRVRAIVTGPDKRFFTIVKKPENQVRHGKSTRLNLLYSPDAPGAHRAQVVIRSNADNESRFRVKLRGEGE